MAGVEAVYLAANCFLSVRTKEYPKGLAGDCLIQGVEQVEED